MQATLLIRQYLLPVTQPIFQFCVFLLGPGHSYTYTWLRLDRNRVLYWDRSLKDSVYVVKSSALLVRKGKCKICILTTPVFEACIAIWRKTWRYVRCGKRVMKRKLEIFLYCRLFPSRGHFRFTTDFVNMVELVLSWSPFLFHKAP
jgi:hypothetical protein